MGIRPIERPGQACAPVELAFVAPGAVPLQCSLRQVAMKHAPVRAFGEPADESWPMLEQRLVNELDGPVVGDEQSAFDECLQHLRDAFVIGGAQFGTSDPPPREHLAVAARDEPEDDAARDVPLVLAERSESRLGVATDGAANTT